MEILILGGTGAMGAPLVDLLSKKENCNVYVTTRQQHLNKKNIQYIKGNAKDQAFFLELMKTKYDVIVDFMVYSTIDFKKRVNILLEHTNQYIYFSSARCYADSNEPILETSPRLIDNCNDSDYLLTDEYALAKGKEENILIESNYKNWTIIRPYITYNSYRLQLGVYEKEDWLRRVLEGKKIVFPKDIANKKTTLTYGPDIAHVIFKLIGNSRAIGQIYHVTTSESHTWKEILDFYAYYIEKKTGIKLEVKFVENSEMLQKVWPNPWQIKKDRLCNRVFDNSKIENITDNYKFKSLESGLSIALDKFLDNPIFLKNINIKYEAWSDKECGEYCLIKKIEGVKNKLRYIKYRFF